MRHSLARPAPAKRQSPCVKRLIQKILLLSERSASRTEALEVFVDHVLALRDKRRFPHRKAS